MEEGEPKYIEGTQIIRKTGLIVDYNNALTPLGMCLTQWRLGEYKWLASSEEEMKAKIIQNCQKVKTYEERYVGSDVLDNITPQNRTLVDAVNERVLKIRAYGTKTPNTFTSVDQIEIDKLIDEVHEIIDQGKTGSEK